jgi:iron complex transport system substrate-binding protein
MTFVVMASMRQFPPRRIVCLTEETVETLYLLGEQDRIVGVSGYAVRPRQVRREKPRVSAFVSADIPKILALEPDLVLAFSDLQADIAGTWSAPASPSTSSTSATSPASWR